MQKSTHFIYLGYYVPHFIGIHMDKLLAVQLLVIPNRTYRLRRLTFLSFQLLPSFIIRGYKTLHITKIPNQHLTGAPWTESFHFPTTLCSTSFWHQRIWVHTQIRLSGWAPVNISCWAVTDAHMLCSDTTLATKFAHIGKIWVADKMTDTSSNPPPPTIHPTSMLQSRLNR